MTDPDRMNTQPIFLGSHPAVDFLNTALAPGGNEIEALPDGRAYLGWAVAAGLLPEAEAARWSRRFDAKAWDRAASEARKTREWLREWLSRWRKHPRADYAREIAELNELLARDQRTFGLSGAKGEYRI